MVDGCQSYIVFEVERGLWRWFCWWEEYEGRGKREEERRNEEVRIMFYRLTRDF